jgi:hypothetical protein
MQASSHRDAEHTRSLVGVIACTALLVAWPIAVALVRHDGAPVGADTPVYVWWARLVGSSGSSSVAMRPGVPNVTAIVSTSIGVSETAAVAGLGCALVAIVGLAGGALLRAGGERGRTPLLGLALTGLFASYLASGHLSNAVFAALFVLSLAFVVDGRPSSIGCASLVLGAAGLAHPEFLWIAMSILLGAAALSIAARQRREAAAVAVSAVMGAGVWALGLVAAATGGRAFDVPTSLDVFLMQTHQLGRLQALFLERFRPKVASYALWAWLPLGAVSWRRLRTPVGRLLLSWSAVTVAGVVIGLLWQPFPPHRIVAFASCLPLLAAIGLAAICARFPRYAVPLMAGVVLCVGASATVAWVDAPRPFQDPFDAAAIATEGQIARAPSGLVIVDLPDGANATAVAVIRATNLLRATVPADRIRDVIVRFPEPSVDNADAYSLWRSTQEQIDAAGTATDVSLAATPPMGGPVTSTAELGAATAGWLVVCGIAGCGWSYATGQRGVRLLERSIGVGLAALILASSLVDRLGLRLGQRSTALGLILAVTAAGGVAAVATRHTGHSTPSSRGAGLTRIVRGRLPSLDPSGTA